MQRVVIAQGIGTVVQSIHFRWSRFLQTCQWPLCVWPIVPVDLKGDTWSAARCSFCGLHGVPRSGLPRGNRQWGYREVMNEHRQRSPSSHLPPPNIAIHVESVDPQPDGGKSVHGGSVIALGSHNPSLATMLCKEAQIFHIQIDIFEFF